MWSYLITIMILFVSILAIPTPTLGEINNSCPSDMRLIEGGTFVMGSDEFYPEEYSVSDVTISKFCMSKYEITNDQFAQFVEATDYVTIAERPLSQAEFPNLTEKERSPGSVIFRIPEPLPDGSIGYLSWWHWVPGANWRHPEGPQSDLAWRGNHPVVHIAYEDALAYAQWADASLPTETQWEFAARGGLKKQIFTWGSQYSPKKANTWQGKFPLENKQVDGYFFTAPVGSFAPNGYGLYDMTGNVWEWTQDWYNNTHKNKAHQVNPVVAKEDNFDPREPGVPKHVLKGGSFLCAKNYCSRYRPAARQPQSPDTGMSHIGFRLVKNLA